MSRTFRDVNHRHMGSTLACKRERLKEINYEHFGWLNWRDTSWERDLERDIALHGTDAANYKYGGGTREYFNRNRRKARSYARNQLRTHLVLDDNFEYDPTKELALKSTWWDIF